MLRDEGKRRNAEHEGGSEKKQTEIIRFVQKWSQQEHRPIYYFTSSLIRLKCFQQKVIIIFHDARLLKSDGRKREKKNFENEIRV